MVLDGAHNPDGARAAADTLRDEFTISGRRRWVLGMLAGRDLDEMVAGFGIAEGDHVVACTPPSPRGVPADQLAAVVGERGIEAVAVPDVGAAVEGAWAAAGDAGEADAVLVTGSLYVVGAARTACRRLGLLAG